MMTAGAAADTAATMHTQFNKFFHIYSGRFAYVAGVVQCYRGLELVSSDDKLVFSPGDGLDLQVHTSKYLLFSLDRDGCLFSTFGRMKGRTFECFIRVELHMCLICLFLVSFFVSMSKLAGLIPFRLIFFFSSSSSSSSFVCVCGLFPCLCCVFFFEQIGSFGFVYEYGFPLWLGVIGLIFVGLETQKQYRRFFKKGSAKFLGNWVLRSRLPPSLTLFSHTVGVFAFGLLLPSGRHEYYSRCL